MKFRDDNTEGFTQAELDTLNAAYNKIAPAAGPDLEKAVADAINNAWLEGVTADYLISVVAPKFGVNLTPPVN